MCIYYDLLLNFYDLLPIVRTIHQQNQYVDFVYTLIASGTQPFW